MKEVSINDLRLIQPCLIFHESYLAALLRRDFAAFVERENNKTTFLTSDTPFPKVKDFAHLQRHKFGFGSRDRKK